VHPGITIASIMYIAGIILIVVGIEKIISGIFVANKSRWGAVGLGVLAIIFGSIAVAAPVSTAVFVIFILGFGLLFLGISHVVYGIGSSQSPGWARGFSIGAGTLAIAISFLVMASRWCCVCIYLFGNSTDNNRNHRSWSDRKKNANDTIHGHVALKL
jgi:uncharacterized membrane protein HdeD (DUF308 family)